MKIGKRDPIEFRRSFLLNSLPRRINSTDSHLQILDSYVADGAIRLRSIRLPETNVWTRLLEKRVLTDEVGKLEVYQIELTETEYDEFKTFEGWEIRKNRYLCKLNDVRAEVDVYLGPLLGLYIAKAYFEKYSKLIVYKVPEISLAEITSKHFYSGENLVSRTFADVQAQRAKEKGG